MGNITLYSYRDDLHEVSLNAKELLIVTVHQEVVGRI